MTTLSEILAAIETSAAKVKTLEAELTTERENSKTLVEQYRAHSGERSSLPGIETPRKERKPRSQSAILTSAASRAIRKTVKSGEKNAKAILAAAIDVADSARATSRSSRPTWTCSTSKCASLSRSSNR